MKALLSFVVGWIIVFLGQCVEQSCGFTATHMATKIRVTSAWGKDPMGSTTSLNVVPSSVEMIPDAVASSSIALSGVTREGMGELAKSIFIVLLFGGGLIPAAIAANRSMMGTMMGTRRGGEDGDETSATSLDPYKRQSNYVKRPYVVSDATGPAMPLSGLLFANDRIPLVDIVAIVGRLPNVESVADWKNLPSTKLNDVNPSNPPMWLPRSTFKENVRRAKFAGWPTDVKTKTYVGGQALYDAERKRVSSADVEIGDAALDAVFDTWAWGASVGTPDKVQSQFSSWRQSADSFSLNKFVAAAVRGRSVTGLGILSFIVIQVIAYGTLFVAPFFRVFFDIDLGLGELGSCSANGCQSLSQLLNL